MIQLCYYACEGIKALNEKLSPHAVLEEVSLLFANFTRAQHQRDGGGCGSLTPRLSHISGNSDLSDCQTVGRHNSITTLPSPIDRNIYNDSRTTS